MLKAVLFDFDQTVVNSAQGFRSAEHWLQKEIFSFLKLSDWDPFITRYREFRRRGSVDTPEQKLEQWRAFCREFQSPPGEDLLLKWRNVYWGLVENGSTLFPETISVLGNLKQHFLLGLITNASSSDGKFHRIEPFPELNALFDRVVLCGGPDIPAKPHEEGFQRMLSSLGVSADEAVHIGDDPVNDIQGACGAGILPILLRHRDIQWNRPLPGIAELVLIDSLNPLCALDPADSRITIEQKLEIG
ncbi:MAG: HAD family hydrolase [Puniceicoccaceae bacterium]